MSIKLIIQSLRSILKELDEIVGNTDMGEKIKKILKETPRKEVHWTQTPEGKKRMSIIGKKRWNKK